MQYNLATQLDRQRIETRLASLKAKGAVVELTEKTFRSRNQNNYLHLLIGLVAMEVGETTAFVKDYYFKRLCNPDVFIIRKTDKYAGDVETLRSSADLTVEEMTTAIDRFSRWGREQGWVMPEPGDDALLRDLEIEMGRNARYL